MLCIPSYRKLAGVAFGIGLLCTSTVSIATDKTANPAEAQKMMQQMMSMMTPELQKKVQALSPESRKTMAQLQSLHDRRSKSLTMRQVMQEILADYQRMAAAIATDNGEMAVDAARNLAGHRLPRGGLIPYMPLEKVNDQGVAALPTFQEMVEGNTLRLAEAAENGDMARAAGYLGQVAQGCVACHNYFRGQPGVSPHLQPQN